MKKSIVFAIVSLLLLAAVPLVAAAGGLKVVIFGKPVTFADAQPYNNGDTVMIPIRPAADALQMKIAFDPASKAIRLTTDGIAVVFKTGSTKALRDGVEVTFGTASATKHNRVYVPLSFYRDVLGYETAYDAGKKTASLKTAPVVFEPGELATRWLRF